MKYSNDSLRAHAYGRTRYSLSVETRTDALDKLEQAENAERAKGSTACRFDIGAKPCEGLVRDLLNGADDTVRFVVSQLSDVKYELTVKNFQAALTTRDSWLANFVPKAILAYHLKRLQWERTVLTRELAAAGTDRQREIFSALENINELNKIINIKLGRLK